MQDFWMRVLGEAEQAEARAKALRQRYGDGAEARCRAELRDTANRDPRRRRLLADVQRALRWT